jgi:3D (Asp-Asp-Asp) domain-containing protein
MIVTAYCACALCCGPSASGLTARGTRPVQGITVAASRSIPLGTRIRLTVPGLWKARTFTVQDRLAQRYDDRLDIYFSRHSDAVKFGVKQGHIAH